MIRVRGGGECKDLDAKKKNKKKRAAFLHGTKAAAGEHPINVKKVEFDSCRCRASAAIIILHHALMAEADRQPLPCMFTANIAFKRRCPSQAPEDGPDISRERSMKGGVFIVMSIENDNNGSRLPASALFPDFGADGCVCVGPVVLHVHRGSPPRDENSVVIYSRDLTDRLHNQIAVRHSPEEPK